MTSLWHSLLWKVRRATQPKGQDAVLDAQLLERFLDHGDEAALELLIWRHERMVFAVCRRVLQDVHDTEDAFQATFLAFVRHAPSICNRRAIGSWLYKVAFRVALSARSRRIRRAECEMPVGAESELVAAETHEDQLSSDVRPIVDEELSRLPEKYQAPLVLCYLRGQTHEQAAQQLGLPKGTVASRLARGRDRLRVRLARRGLMLSAGALGSVLAQSGASAAVSAGLVFSTIQAANSFAAGNGAHGLASARVVALAEGVLRTMYLTRMAITTLLLLLVGVIGTGSGLLLQSALAARDAVQPVQANPIDRPPAQKPEAKGEPKPRILKVEGGVFRMAWSPDGNTLASVTYTPEKEEKLIKGEKKTVFRTNSTVKFWDAAKGELKLSLGEEKKVRIGSIAVARDAKLAAIAVSWDDGMQRVDPYEVRIVDPQTGTIKTTIGQGDPIRSVVLSPDGKTLAFGGTVLPRDLNGPFHRFVRVWDVEKGKVTKEHKQELDSEKVLETGYLDGLRDLVYSPDGKLLAAADADWKVRVLEVETGKLRHTLAGHTSVVLAVAFSPDGKTLVSGSFDRTIKVWDMESGKELRTLQSKGQVNAVSFSADKKLLATAGSEVILWDTSSWQPKQTLRDQGVAVSFSPGDGKTLAVGGFNQIKLWRVQDVLFGK